VSFSSTPSLFPKFGPNIHDYVVRCNDGPVTVTVHASGGWEAAIGNRPFRQGEFSETVPLSSGRAFTVTAREVGRPQLYRRGPGTAQGCGGATIGHQCPNHK
jgi:hypothetical protein